MNKYKTYKIKKTNLGYRVTKRIIDIIGGLVGLIFSSPIILYTIFKIKQESPGPAVFKQERIGIGGKPSTIYKLRGMYIDSKERFPHLYDYSDKKI